MKFRVSRKGVFYCGEPKWHILTSQNWVTINLGDSLSPVQPKPLNQSSKRVWRPANGKILYQCQDGIMEIMTRILILNISAQFSLCGYSIFRCEIFSAHAVIFESIMYCHRAFICVKRKWQPDGKCHYKQFQAMCTQIISLYWHSLYNKGCFGFTTRVKQRRGPAVKCRTRDKDRGQVPGSIPCRCICSLCPWARHFTLHCLSRPKRKWVPVRADL